MGHSATGELALAWRGRTAGSLGSKGWPGNVVGRLLGRLGNAAGGRGGRGVGAAGVVGRLLSGEICTANTGLVGEVDDDRKVAKVRRVVLVGRGEEIDVFLRPCLSGDVAVLAAQVTDLAGLGLARIADGDLATVVRVKMSAGASAVAIGGNGLGMDVVDERAALGWESREGDGEAYALSIGC